MEWSPGQREALPPMLHSQNLCKSVFKNPWQKLAGLNHNFGIGVYSKRSKSTLRSKSRKIGLFHIRWKVRCRDLPICIKGLGSSASPYFDHFGNDGKSDFFR
jgi:hypothetical protein